VKLKYIVALVLLTVLLTAAPAIILRRRSGLLKRFFQEPASPFPLAFFRITFFLSFLLLFENRSIRFSALPHEFLFPPIGWNWILDVLPIREPDTRLLYFLHRGFLLSSAAGFCTRTSIIGVLATGTWLLGIPQFYGKINHYHHLLWFTAVFAASPCADALSIDALWKARRRTDLRVISPPSSSVVYALPLKMFWLLLGMIYFWAGFWKVWTAGLEWAFSDNLRFILYNKWAELDWIPPVRIDHYPLLYQSLAALTLLFETSFIFLIFDRRLRVLAFLGGMAFHNSTNYFMAISFIDLQFCYVCLLDWDRIWAWMARRIFPHRLSVAFDHDCRPCRRIVAMLHTFDVFRRVDFVDLPNRQPGIETAPKPGLDSSAMVDIHHSDSRMPPASSDTFRELRWRFPPLWPLLPLMVLPFARRTGRGGHHSANAREDLAPSDAPQWGDAREGFWARTTLGMGYGLFAIVALCSLAKFQGWPFAGYPTFEDAELPRMARLTVHVSTPAKDMEVSIQALYRKLEIPSSNLLGLISRIFALPDSDEKDRKFCALWTEVSRATGLPRHAKLTFYRDVFRTFPEDRGRPPLERTIVYATDKCRGDPRDG